MDHERPDLIARILSGELDEETPSVREQLEAHPEMKRELSELRRLQGLLDDDGQAEREALAEERQLEPATSPARPRPTLVRAVVAASALAAAALLAFLVVPALTGGKDDPGPSPWEGRTMGAGTLRIVELAPVGSGQSLEEFRVVASLPPGRVEFRVWAADAPEDAVPLQKAKIDLRHAEPDGVTWKPSADPPLPDAIRWEVLIKDVKGTVLAQPRSWASR